MGAGTIGRAALNLNRRFIGIEKDSQVFQSTQAELKVTNEDKGRNLPNPTSFRTKRSTDLKSS